MEIESTTTSYVHMALNGKTPAEVAKVNLELGQNRWASLIRRSATNKKERGKRGLNT